MKGPVAMRGSIFFVFVAAEPYARHSHSMEQSVPLGFGGHHHGWSNASRPAPSLVPSRPRCGSFLEIDPRPYPSCMRHAHQPPGSRPDVRRQYVRRRHCGNGSPARLFESAESAGSTRLFRSRPLLRTRSVFRARSRVEYGVILRSFRFCDFDLGSLRAAGHRIVSLTKPGKLPRLPDKATHRKPAPLRRGAGFRRSRLFAFPGERISPLRPHRRFARSRALSIRASFAHRLRQKRAAAIDADAFALAPGPELPHRESRVEQFGSSLRDGRALLDVVHAALDRYEDCNPVSKYRFRMNLHGTRARRLSKMYPYSTQFETGCKTRRRDGRRFFATAPNANAPNRLNGRSGAFLILYPRGWSSDKISRLSATNAGSVQTSARRGRSNGTTISRTTRAGAADST